MNGEPQRQDFSRLIQTGLFVVAVISIACAIARGFLKTVVIDEKTAMFLALGVVALVIHQITKFKGFGIEFEKAVKQIVDSRTETIKEDVKNVGVSVVKLEKGVGQGSKAATSPAPQALPEPAANIVKKKDVDSNDPNKNQFGSSPISNGRKLTASIQPIAGPKSSLCRVNIRIVSTDQSRPLEGRVKLFLHPTFGRASAYDVEVKDGVAEDTIESYGAFTIGAQMDNGQTRLELDLMDVQGGTEQFYKE